MLPRSAPSPSPLHLLLALCVLLFAACRASAPAIVEEAPPDEGPAAGWYEYGGLPAGASVEGRKIEVVLRGRGPRTVLLISTIHGDEAAGTPLLRELVDRLDDEPALLAGVRVVVVPVANPDGRAADTRGNANGVDLNRNFPASNRREDRRHGPFPLSEPEARFLLELITTFQPDRIVSIHQPLSLVDWDGPGEELARAMATSTRLPARRHGSMPGSLGSYAGEDLGIPIVTVELPRGADRLEVEEAWTAYGAMLLRALRF